jgi:pumilio RNA-binding family
MLGRIQGSLVKLAKNQYSSHVCEKAIIYSTAETRRQLIDEIMSTGDGEHSISVMIKDDFASGSVFDVKFSLIHSFLLDYVLQRALAEAEGEQRKVLFHSVRAFLTPLKTSPASYGKQLVRSEWFTCLPFSCTHHPSAVERLLDKHFGRKDKAFPESAA